METKNNEYNFSIFKPVSEYGRKNKNIIISMVIIWFVAVFGFQLLLRLLEKPTPEKTLITFEKVWDNVKNRNANAAEKQDFTKSLIAVAGKSTLKKDERIIIGNAVTWSAFNILSDSEKVSLTGYITELKETREKLVKADNEEYVQLQELLSKTKNSINILLDNKIGIESTSVEASILPYNLNAENKELTEDDIAALPKIMKLYLTHNQSFLTDTKFLGFPFHYFYTAEFLLILFVLLCLIYSIRIQQLQKKYNIVEK